MAAMMVLMIFERKVNRVALFFFRVANDANCSNNEWFISKRIPGWGAVATDPLTGFLI